MILKKRFSALTLAVVLAFSLAVPAFAAEETVPTRAESAQAAIGYAGQYGGATSIQYALWEDGKITMTGKEGVYSKTENRALTEDILYGIGSVSKIYTTTAVMQLVDDGKIDLDKPVTTYLPTFKMADGRYKDITVRMLLNHSSGLMGSSTGNAFLFDDADQIATTDLLNRLSTQRLKAAPGAFSVYCNDGFTLAELVVEAVSGQSFGDYLHEHILKPAGLASTFIPADGFDTKRLAKTYDSDDTRALPQDTLGIVGTGGIYATASDLAAFGGALTTTKLLTANSAKAMAAEEYKNGLWPADDADLLAFGLGWDTVHCYPFAQSQIQALAKGGDTLRYHAGLVVLPEHKMAVAVLSSGGVSTYNQMAAERILVDALAAKGIAVDETLSTLPAAKPAPMPKKLTENSGYYGATTQQMKITVTEDGKLSIHSLTVPTMPEQVFAYCDDGSFRDPTGAMMLKFVTEKNGRTYLWQKACGNLPGLGLLPTSNYLCEKLPENKLDDATQKAWDSLSTMGLALLNEKYTSQVYPTLLTPPAVMPEFAPGYLGAVKLTDATHGAFALQIPGNAGRDGQDTTVYQQDGTTYMNVQGMLFADAATVPTIYAGNAAYTTIQPTGYARWYQVAPGDVGKTMTVTLPEKGGFYVYDSKGAVVSSSVLYGDKTAVLPKDGAIVFAGDAGMRFHLTFAPAQ
ncbi:MAG: serine hydrolase domain-containing protein [Oscillospiraceae bacterium]